MSSKGNVTGRLETKTSFIKDLIADINKGEVKIPQFQRKFVWKDTQALELLDSIANNYPVGSLLLWKTTSKLAVERNIGDFKLPKTDDHSPTDYVLDGQQRITVIYSCLGAPIEETGFAAGYDLDTEEFVQIPAEGRHTVFPLRLLFNTTELLNYRTGLQAHASAGKVHQVRLDGLVEAFTAYKLPVVILKELTVEEVCPIFERINSAGTKLSMFDLMVAATWSPEFDMNELAKTIAASLEAKGFEGIEQTTILKCLAAVQFGGLKRDQLLNLRKLTKEQMNALVEKTKSAMLRAVDLLYTEFNIYSWDFLPYEAVLVVLCYACSKMPAFDTKQQARIRQWFWRASFNERYRVGGEGFVSRDLERVLKFLNDGEKPDDFGTPLGLDQIIATTFRSNNSKSRAFILALAKARPRNLTNGAVIDPAEALSQFNKKQFHHIYPLAYLRKSGEQGEPNSIANICMLAAAENNAVSDANPKEYLPALITTHGKADEILGSNLMPVVGADVYSILPYEAFLQVRASVLKAHIERLTLGE